MQTVFSAMPESKYPPMTREELREITQRRLGDPDIMKLLWEVSRLRDHARQTHYVYRMWINDPNSMAIVCAETHLRQLDKEPFVREDDEDERARSHIPGTEYYKPKPVK